MTMISSVNTGVTCAKWAAVCKPLHTLILLFFSMLYCVCVRCAEFEITQLYIQLKKFTHTYTIYINPLTYIYTYHAHYAHFIIINYYKYIYYI